MGINVKSRMAAAVKALKMRQGQPSILGNSVQGCSHILQGGEDVVYIQVVCLYHFREISQVAVARETLVSLFQPDCS